jgi:hypothetical protein
MSPQIPGAAIRPAQGRPFYTPPGGRPRSFGSAFNTRFSDRVTSEDKSSRPFLFVPRLPADVSELAVCGAERLPEGVLLLLLINILNGTASWNGCCFVIVAIDGLPGVGDSHTLAYGRDLFIAVPQAQAGVSRTAWRGCPVRQRSHPTLGLASV